MMLLIAPLLLHLVHAGIKEDHEIKDLPGLNGTLSFKQYAGYLNVSKTRKLAYWFLGSQSDPQKDPLMLWLDGGPGCSSLSGLILENGPFRISTGGNPDGRLYENVHSYNKFLNIIYLEAPAGVGFSKIYDDEAHFDDEKTANDNLKFLAEFVKAYSEFEGRDFYISGISYAGCYVPHLADTIIRHGDELKLSLKGIAMGNAVTNREWWDSLAYPTAAYYGIHSILELSDWMGRYCSDGFENFCGKDVAGSRDRIDGINPYDFTDNHGLDYEDACMQAYLNQPEVQMALHFDETEWKHCNNSLGNDFIDCDDPEPLIRGLLDNHIRVLYYYGTADAVCPFTNGDFFTRKIGVNGQSSHWYLNGVYSGTKIVYPRNLTYATVLGAGHPSAKHKPEQVANVIRKFVNNEDDWDS